MTEAWTTDDDLRAARERSAAQVPGYTQPTAYAVARRDGDAATHAEHLDLWSWRRLLADPGDPPVDADDARFRELLPT